MSLVIPTLTKSGIGRHVIDAVRHRFAELLVDEIVHVHTLRVALGPIVGTTILEVADQLFLLRIDRDDRLSGCLRRNDLHVDVLELCVAVGMPCAFIRLAIVLAREAELHQLLAHGIGADRVPHRRQRLGQLVHALRHPDQRPYRIAEGCRLDKALELGHKLWIRFGNGPASATAATNLPLRQRLRIEIVLAAIDRRAGEPGDPRDNRKTAPAGGPHLGRCEQAPPPLVEPDADRVPAILNGVLVDHATDIPLFAQIRNPSRLSHTVARTRIAIQLLFEMSLRQAGRLRELPDEALERPFAASFALEQMHRNLQDLDRCIEEWTARRG